MRHALLSLLCLAQLSACTSGSRLPASSDEMVAQEMPAALNKAAAARPETVLDGELTALLARYADAYNQQDYAGLLNFWDRQDPNVFYMAEEIDPPMQGWKLIDAYFARPGVLDGIRNEYSNVRAHYLAPDIAIATYRLRFDIKVKNMKPLSGFDRVVAVFRRKDGEWKFAAYAEAPQAPLTMVRKLLKTSKSLTPDQQKQLLKTIQALQEDAVPADFEAWISSQPGLHP
ncbi:MAG: nuclear transport factor 2 family protein [Gammaproteobacteria bacterium]